jgi:predicted Zn-dependent protease
MSQVSAGRSSGTRPVVALHDQAGEVGINRRGALIGVSALEQLPPSHLARAVLYAQAGAVDDAERELAALAERNPESPLVDALLTDLRSARGR